MTVPPVAVLLPVKRFEEAKARLAPALDGAARAALAREMAEKVVEACAGLSTSVVCDDDDVARWAAALGLAVIWTPGVGLNGAVARGVEHLAGAGAARVIVAHADLAHLLPGDLNPFVEGEGVQLAPDRHEDGTNIAAIPSGAGFSWSYGPGSFGRHCSEAKRCGQPLFVVRGERLAWDVDTPADLSPIA